MNSISSVSIIGAGNVAFHLAKALTEKGICIDFFWNRTSEKAIELAGIFKCRSTDELEDLKMSDLLICAVSDDALMSFIPRLSEIAPVVTTSGTVDVMAIQHRFPIGVFYPLQTFSKNRVVNMRKVPFFVESTSSELTQDLLSLGKKISDTVTELIWDKRVQLHLSAVFVNNFTNHLIDIAQQRLFNSELSFSWLQPLLHETIAKLEEQTAYSAQTGPAKRYDSQTIERHLSLLSSEEAEIYRLLTSSIQQRFKQHDKL